MKDGYLILIYFVAGVPGLLAFLYGLVSLSAVPAVVGAVLLGISGMCLKRLFPDMF